MNCKLLLLVGFLGMISCDPRKKKSHGDLDTLEARGKRLSYVLGSSYGNKLALEGDQVEDYSGGDVLGSLGEGAATLDKTTPINQGAYRATTRLAATPSSDVKRTLVSTLQDQLYRAHELVLVEAEQLKQAQTVAQDAQQVAKQASYQVAALSSALHNAQADAHDAHEAANQATAESASQAAMLDRARRLLSAISEHLSAAQAQLEAVTVQQTSEEEGDH